MLAVMNGYYSIWSIILMLVPLALIGLVIYWAVYSGVRKAMNNRPPE